MIRVPQVGRESGIELGQAARDVEAALRASNLGAFKRVGTEIVGPVVGRELTSKGVTAFALSLFFILLYIWFRFQFSFAVGATVATLHDVLVTLAFLVFFRVRPLAERHRRAADDHRVLDQRHDRHLRPRPREPARNAAAIT